jgi:multicomponent Na+:H+ antiporter subunit B
VLASALLLVYLAGEYRWVEELRPISLVEGAEATGAGAYVLIGAAGMVFGVAFLDNILPVGTLGQLNSGGVVPFINLAVGLEVAAGFVLLLTEFLVQSVILRRLAWQQKRAQP